MEPGRVPVKPVAGNPPCRVAILSPGDREQRRTATPANSRFAPVFEALDALGAQAEPAVYHDDFHDGEINVSSVAPFPDSAVEPLARAAVARAQARRKG